MNWKYFIGGSILAVGLLIKAGAPLVPVAAGVLAVGIWNWRAQQRQESSMKPR
jgi:hypothetical protein